jgi:hypothetical protein
VPKVACFAVAGVELWFNSNDHLPPHFHAEKAREWQVRVFFLRDPSDMTEIVYSRRSRRPSKSDLKEIVQQAAARRFALYSQWQTVVNVKTAGSER